MHRILIKEKTGARHSFLKRAKANEKTKNADAKPENKRFCKYLFTYE